MLQTRTYYFFERVAELYCYKKSPNPLLFLAHFHWSLKHQKSKISLKRYVGAKDHYFVHCWQVFKLLIIQLSSHIPLPIHVRTCTSILHCTPLIIVKDQQYSHSVYPNIYIQYTNMWIFTQMLKHLLKIMKEKHPCCTNVCAFKHIIKGFRNYLFLCYFYVTSGAAVSHNVLNTINSSPLTSYQVSFYANNNSVHGQCL